MKKELKIQTSKIPESFDGVFIIGDVHGDLESFSQAIAHAEKHNLYLISLGDIVDYGPDSATCFKMFLELYEQGRATMVQGNHELKNYRYFVQSREGNVRVQMQEKHWISVRSFEKRGEAFVQKFLDIMDSIPHIFQTVIDNRRMVFTHGAVNRLFWNYDEFEDCESIAKIDAAIINHCYFGELDHQNRFLENGMPNRTYDWADYVPNNCSVFVGHAVYDAVTLRTNRAGGRSYQVDTGCSKGGYLSGVEILRDGGQSIVTFEKRALKVA